MTIFFDPLHSPTGGVCRNVILRSDRDEKDTKAAMGLVMDGSFILASASPRRIELLKGFGLSFDVIPSGADESFRPGETPRDHVRRISGAKALAVAADHPDAWVLGADTIVVIDGRVLGKPKDKEDARNMLRLLSGQEHSVYTGFSIVGKAKALLRQRVVRSVVVFRRISEDELEWYVNSDEPYDKAGGYAVQEKGGLFARRIRGSYSNVIGLPVSEVFEVLKEIGAIRFNGVCHEQFG
ncbi:MAG TPA: Maf family protein [Syntrophales bacterium]|nr:Maf family protein [Syntrophales bacterium]